MKVQAIAGRLLRVGLAALGVMFLATAAAGNDVPASPTSSVPKDPAEQLDKATALVKQLDQSAQRAERAARRSAAEAERARRQAQTLLDANEIQRKNALARAEAAQAAADASKAEAEKAKLKATKAAADLATLKAKLIESDGNLRRTLFAGAAVVVFAAIVALMLWRRARSRRIPQSPNCVLTSPRINLPLSGKSLPNVAGGVILGRNPREAQAVINDNDVSRRHARVFWEEEAFWIEDLGSLNGTKVDGKQLEPGVRHRLQSGDLIDVAEVVEFRFDILE